MTKNMKRMYGKIKKKLLQNFGRKMWKKGRIWKIWCEGEDNIKMVLKIGVGVWIFV